jgi:molecular chaperone DnaJ
MPYLNDDNRGDLLVKVIVQIPANLTKKQEDLMKEAFADYLPRP